MASPEAGEVKCDIAVVGGGLGGLALAAGLARRGWDVRVFEAAPELRTSTSTLLGLGDNGFTALEYLHPQSVPEIQKAGALNTMIVANTKPAPDAPMTTRAAPPNNANFFTIRWSEVQRVLAGLVPPSLVHCGYRATGYTEGADRVKVHFKDKPDVEARFVVAADGLRSALRATMIPNDPGPRYLGHMNWNALLKNPGGSVVPDLHGTGDIRSYLNTHFTGSWSIFVFVIDAGGGYSFWQVRVQSDEPSFTPPPGQEAGQADTQLTDAQPYLVGGGLGKPGSKARVLEYIKAAGFDTEPPFRAVQATPESDIFERAMLDRIPLDELGATLVSSGGRVVLLGDAAHAMHSGPGQGARSAFEDAHTLALALEAVKTRLAATGWKVAPAEGEQGGVEAGLSGLALGTEAELDTLAGVGKAYNDARLVRVCRIQRFAAEGCGLKSIKDKYRPPGIPAGDREVLASRMRQFSSWINKYPENPDGDPDSEFWKPLDSSSGAGGGQTQGAEDALASGAAA